MTSSDERRVVTIFGSSQPAPAEKPYNDAYELGYALGQAGFVVCNGGYGGTMAAAAKGAKDAGSTTIGVTCVVFSRSKANAYIDTEHQAADLNERLNRLIELADAFVILPGGSGTLVELALAWELTAKKIIKPRPIILYGDFWQSVVDTAAVERPKTRSLIQTARTSQQVVDILQTP